MSETAEGGQPRLDSLDQAVVDLRNFTREYKELGLREHTPEVEREAWQAFWKYYGQKGEVTITVPSCEEVYTHKQIVDYLMPDEEGAQRGLVYIPKELMELPPEERWNKLSKMFPEQIDSAEATEYKDTTVTTNLKSGWGIQKFLQLLLIRGLLTIN